MFWLRSQAKDFSNCALLQEAQNLNNLINTYIVMKNRLFENSFSILEGSGRERKINVSTLVYKDMFYQIAVSYRQLKRED